MILIISRFEEKLIGSRKWFSHCARRSNLAHFFVNKVLLERRHPHSFTCCYSSFHTTKASLNSWDRDRVAHRVYKDDDKEKEEEGDGEEEMKKGRGKEKGRGEVGRGRTGNRQRRRDGEGVV